ncbi:hypothetical protein FN846DRAFT_894714 [Sphaerosporella brunnea]|uniref:Tim44-like domain-containing protein n=1 Tax=Sphaerosporella brunnea TaxID=1250544 RepID=A0A5J5EHW3_9PEZI|nr:hypothetical protein FN846DRAFT_894714 [Sphaerosporella brunnea]
MGLIKFLFNTSVFAAAGSATAFTLLTRKSVFAAVPPVSDDAFKAAHLDTFNPNRNPAVHDRCVRRVRLDKIRPDLLESEGGLVTQFCRGIWGGKGYEAQRRILSRYHESEKTAHQLWSPEALANSNYEVGTQITDHFEVIQKTPERIVMRCGDSPMKRGVRETDGLFDMEARVLKDEGVVEFALESYFFQGLGKAEGITSKWMDMLHRVYTKMWMETAIWNCMK